MRKQSKSICFRIDEADRQLIEAAAKRECQTLSDFVKVAAIKAAMKKPLKKTEPAFDDSRAAREPEFIRAARRHASQGGANGYKTLGYIMATRIIELKPRGYRGLDDDEWAVWLNQLRELIWPTSSTTREDNAVLRWFIATFPLIMNFIPNHREYIRYLDSFHAGRVGFKSRGGLKSMTAVITPSNGAARKRAHQFLEGVYQAANNDEIEFPSPNALTTPAGSNLRNLESTFALSCGNTA